MWTSLIAQLVKNPPAMQETPVRFLGCVKKICWRRDSLPIPVFLGFPCGSAGKESACNARDLGSVPGLGRSPGKGIGYPLQYSWTFLVAQLVKTACNAGDVGLIPGLGRSSREGTGYPLQYFGLENSMACILPSQYMKKNY